MEGQITFSLAGDEKGLAPMDPLAEVGHEVAEGPRLPALVESREALGDAIGGGSDLVCVDRVALLAGRVGVPEDQGLAADHALARGLFAGGESRQVPEGDSGFESR